MTARVSPAIACSVVLLPAPFRPVSTVTRPGSITALRSRGEWPSRPATLRFSSRITAARATTVRVSAGCAIWLADECECLVGRGSTVLSGMEFHADATQRPVHVRCQQQHRQTRGQAHLAEHQAQADTDRHQRHAQRGQQFEHQRRQERDPQRRDRRAPVGGSRVRRCVVPGPRRGPAPAGWGCRRSDPATAPAGSSWRPARPRIDPPSPARSAP